MVEKSAGEGEWEGLRGHNHAHCGLIDATLPGNEEKR